MPRPLQCVRNEEELLVEDPNKQFYVIVCQLELQNATAHKVPCEGDDAPFISLR